MRKGIVWSFVCLMVLMGLHACGGGGGTPAVPASAPAAPMAPTLSAGNAQLTATWAAVAGATSYEVWRNTVNDNATATLDNTVTDNMCVIMGLTNGTPYYVWLKARNAGGTSGFSPGSTGTPVAPASTLLYNNGIHNSQSGSGLHAWEAAIRFPAATMNSYVGWTITSVRVFIGEVPTTNDPVLKIYTGVAEPTIASPAYQQVIPRGSLPTQDWYTITLDTPQTVTNDDYWFSYSAEMNASMGLDGLRTNPLDGAHMYIAGSGWTYIGGLWCIEANLTP